MQKKDEPSNAYDLQSTTKWATKLINILFVSKSKALATAEEFKFEIRWHRKNTQFHVANGKTFPEVNSTYIEKRDDDTQENEKSYISSTSTP